MRRVSKVASLVRGELGRILLQDISDPSLQDVHIMEVELSTDLREAKVFYEGGHSSEKDIEQAFKRAMPFFRRRLGELELRYVPNLYFIRDHHTEQVSRVMHLLDEVRQP